MDPNNLVLEISSDEEGDWNDHGRGVSDGGDDYNWFAELFGDCSDEVMVVSEAEKPVKKSKLKSCLVDFDDDCVILDSDPNAPVDVRNDNPGTSDDVLVVSEKGQVACRDYPHSRHLCIKFPFSSTPNQTHCNQCYCYVCDSLAPCVYWGNGTATRDHCHATDKDEFWILERKTAKLACKVVTQLPPIDLQAPTPPPTPTLANHTSNFQFKGFASQYKNNNINNVLASRTKLHPNLASQLVLRAHQKFNKPVFKRTSSVGVATTVNQNLQSSYKGNFGNFNRQQNYQVNGSKSLQPSAVKTSMHMQYPTIKSSTVNPQVSNQSNPNFQSHVNSNQLYETARYRQPNPLSFRPQPAHSQPSYAVQAPPPSNTFSSKTTPGIDSLLVPNFTHNFSQGVTDTGFKDYGLGWPTGQDSATPDPTNNSSLAVGGLGDYHQFDWMFDDQPIEPGFTDYSSDSAFVDTGPIFNF